MSDYIIGISCYYHDSAACLLKDGVLIAAAEEERFNRKKHYSGFPHLSIQFCLDEEGINYYEATGMVKNAVQEFIRQDPSKR